MVNNINIWSILSYTAAIGPDKIAIKQGQVSVSYNELKERASKVASFIRSKGLGLGDQAAILSPNSINYVDVMFANAKVGVVSDLLNWRLAPPRILELVENSPCKLMFVSAKCASIYDFVRSNVKRELMYVCMDGELDGAISVDELYALDCDPADAPGPAFEDPAIQIYSSGTTNLPKAMVHSVKNFVLKAMIMSRSGNWSNKEVYLITSPLFHSSCTALFTCLYTGSTAILGEPNVAGILSAITEDRATRIGVVPSVLNIILDYLEEHPDTDCSSVASIEYGAAPMTAPQIARSMKFFNCGFYQYYGMTEAAASVTLLTPEHHLDESKLKSVGLPLFGTSVKVVRDDDTECDVNEPGEVIISHPCTIKEYLNNPEQTAKAIKGDWYYSGDVGYLDKDGFLFLVDRKNNMIITGGENVYPQEIIACILKLEGVKDVAVTGVPDDKFGEAIMAAVVRTPGSEVSAEAILEHCKTHMASYKKPRYIYFVDALPVNAMGKVDNKAVKEIHFSKQ